MEIMIPFLNVWSSSSTFYASMQSLTGLDRQSDVQRKHESFWNGSLFTFLAHKNPDQERKRNKKNHEWSDQK